MITISSESLAGAREVLGIDNWHAIKLSWRSSWGKPLLGVVVDATAIDSEEVTKSFPDRGDALAYIADLIKKHDEQLSKEKK
jgi:hypothetical protein